MSRQSIAVRNARANEMQQLAALLAAAFYDDPVWGPYFMPDERRRLAGLTRFFAGELRQFRASSIVRTFGRGLPRVLRATTMVEKQHPRDPHYYLPYIGVTPARQGNGLGTALLRPVLDRCDTEGAPAYLEATNERNLPLYRRQAFQVREDVDLPNGPHLWTMWREPGEIGQTPRSYPGRHS